MRTRSLILTLALPLLPSGIWDGGRSAAEKCDRTDGRSGDYVSAREILTQDYGVKERDLARLCDGKIMIGTLPAADKHQMILIGMVKLKATPAQFADYAEEVERLVATEHVSFLGQIDFSNLQIALQSYPVLLEDIREVPSCEVGDCDVKLPRSIILELSQLNPAANRFDQQVAAAIRQWLHKYLSSYRRKGNVALVEYSDKNPPQSLHDGFSKLIAGAHVLAYRAPRLYDYFNGIVNRPPDGVRESFVWSVEDFGMRPLTTVTHSIVHRDLDGDYADLWVGMKLLYASHYLHASLRLMRVINDWNSAEPASYLVSVDRLLFDAEVGGIKRAMLRRRLRSHLAERLQNISDSVSEYGLMMTQRLEGH